MENNKFQLNFNGGNIAAFVFFSLVSFITIFFLGVLVGKNSVVPIQEIILPIENEVRAEQQTKQKQQIKPKQETPKPETPKPETPKVIPKKPKKTKAKLVISKETKDLFGKNDYVIQVISYNNKNKAESLQRLLKDNFYPAYILKFSKDKKIYYRVRVGSYSLLEAKRVKSDLANQFPKLTNTQIFKINKQK